MAAGLGFEPRRAAPKTAVLPLDDPATSPIEPYGPGKRQEVPSENRAPHGFNSIRAPYFEKTMLMFIGPWFWLETSLPPFISRVSGVLCFEGLPLVILVVRITLVPFTT